MANNQEVHLTISLKGNDMVVKATKNTEKLNKAVNKVNKTTSRGVIEQDKIRKGTAGSKNATTDFAKQAQGMGGLVHVYASVAANVWAMTAAFDVLKRTADISIMAKSAEDLSRATGISFTQVANDMKKITGGAISFTDAMRQGNLALSGGATIEQLKGITDVATKAANTLGLSVPNAVGRMIQAVTKGEPELVDELGIILRVTRASEEYADALGKTVAELTTFEKQQAIINQLLTQGNQKFSEVSKSTNPFAVLSASVEELGVSVLSFGTDILGPVVNIIAKNMFLIGVGIAFVGGKIWQLILPGIIASGAAMKELAAEDMKAAETATEAIAAKAKKLLAIQQQIVKTQKQASKFSGETTGGGAFKALNAEGALGQALDQRGKEAKKLAKILENSGNLTNDQLFKEIKQSKVLVEIKKKIAKGDKNLFKKGTNKQTISLVGEEIDNIRELANAEKKLAKIRATLVVAANEDVATSAQAIILKRRSVFSTGKDNILQAETTVGVFKALWHANTQVSASYATGAVQATLYSRTMLLVERSLIRVKLVMSAVSKLAGFAFSLLPIVASIGLAFEAIKGGLGFLGLLNEEFQENSGVLAEVNKELTSAIEKYKDIGEEIKNIPAGMDETVTKWTKVFNVASQYSDQLGKIIDQMILINGNGFWDNITPAAWNASAEGIASMNVAMQELSKITGDVVSFKVFVPTLGAEDLAQIEKAKNKIRSSISASSVRVRSRKDMDVETDLNKEIARINANPTGLKPVIISSAFGEGGLELAFKDPRVLVAFKKAFPELAKKVLQPFQELAVGSKAVSDAIGNISKKLSDLRNKSESRRILNTDTLIGFRDELKLITKEVQVFFDSSEEAGKESISPLLSGSSKTFLEAFLPNLDLTTVPKEILADLKKELAGLDKDIDITRNLGTNLAIITEELKGFKAGENRGELENILNIYHAQTQTIHTKIQAQEAEIRVTTRLSKLVDDDQGSNILKLALQREQLRQLQKELMWRKDIIPELNIELKLLGRIKDRLKSLAEFNKERTTLLKLNATLGKEYSQTIGLQAEALIKQKDSIAAQLVISLDTLQNKKEELETTILLKLGEGKRAEAAQLSNDLAIFGRKEQTLKLQHLQEELKLTKEIFDTKNLARGQSGTSGLANSFAGFFDDDFWADTGTKFGIIANDMALKIGNSVDNMANIIIGGIENVNDTIVDALLTRTWDGKEEGRSFGHALRESLKATLRASIGESIKANMTQAITRMLGGQTNMISSMSLQVASMQTNTTAVLQNTQALFAARAGSGASPDFISLLTGGGGISPTGSDIAGTPFASGGVVNQATAAVIGEGANSEAVVPLPDNRSIPVKLEGNTGNTVEVHQSFDFTGADSATEGRLRQFAAQIKQETTKEIFDSINRGGSAAKAVRRR